MSKNDLNFLLEYTLPYYKILNTPLLGLISLDYNTVSTIHFIFSPLLLSTLKRCSDRYIR